MVSTATTTHLLQYIDKFLCSTAASAKGSRKQEAVRFVKTAELASSKFAGTYQREAAPRDMESSPHASHHMQSVGNCLTAELGLAQIL